jgi:hypothetical protein
MWQLQERNQRRSQLGDCRGLGINPAEYLQNLFERLPKAKTSEIKSLMPAACFKARQAAARRSQGGGLWRHQHWCQADSIQAIGEG